MTGLVFVCPGEFDLCLDQFFYFCGLFYIPFVANAIFGVNNYCLSVIWVTPALLVEDNQLLTAYGIFGAVINIGYAVVNLIAGQVIDNYGYFAQEVFFICFLAIGILLLVLLIFHLINISWWKHRNKASDKQSESNATVEFWKPEQQTLCQNDKDSSD